MSTTTERYFSILKDYFSDLEKWASKKRYTDLELSRAINTLYSPTMMKTTIESLFQELSKLRWSTQASNVAKLGGLKATYLGEVYAYKRSSLETFDYLKKMGLYSDTIIFNDPILSEALTFEKRQTGEVTSFHLVAHWAHRLLAIEDLFRSELNTPICTLAPSYVFSLEKEGILESTDCFLRETVTPLLASDIFQHEFRSLQELMEFLSHIKSFDEFISLTKKPELLVIPEGDPVDENYLQSLREYYESKYNSAFSLLDSFYLLLRGRQAMLTYDLIVNGKIAPNFITDFKGVLNYFLWQAKNDNELVFKHLEKRPLSKDMLILNALQQEELKWLGNVPLNKLKKMRERGELQEMRDFLRQNVKNIHNVSDEEFVEVGRQVKYNLEEAFKRHDSEVKGLNEKYKRRYAIGRASVVVSGSLGVISTLYPPLALAASVASTIIGSGSLMQMVKAFISKREQLEALQKKPVAMLFDAHSQ
ncbi:MAG: hypothetical protein OEX01_01195 [Candidatus Bathyarchaeota archaeon]|nr:hypothetical protein [Candidatus Bathyarchaeota archaeon]